MLQPCPQFCLCHQFPLFTLYIMSIVLFSTLRETLANSLFENHFFIPRLSPDLLHHENNQLIYLAKHDKKSVFHTSCHEESHEIIFTPPSNPGLRDEESGFRIPVRFFYSTEPPDTAPDPTQPPLQWVPGCFPGAKGAGT